MVSRVCITTAYDDTYRALGELCTKTLVQYAQTFGHDYRIFINRPLVRKHSWDKLLIIQELFSEGYEFVFWVDSDTLFVRFDRDISTEIVPDKHLYLTSYRVTLSPTPYVYTTFDVPLAGFLFLRNVDWTHQLLEKVWNKTEYMNTGASDNAALLDVLGYHYALDLSLNPGKAISDKQNRPDPAYWNFIKRLDANWHGMKGVAPIAPVQDPIVLHYPSQSLKQRAFSMQKEFERSVIKTPPQLFSTIDYDFSQPIDGEGWYIPEYSNMTDCWYRWSGRKITVLYVPLAAGCDYRISFWLVQTLSEKSRDDFQVIAHEEPIFFQCTPAIYGFNYVGIIPRASVEQTNPPMKLIFHVPELHTPQEFFETPDTRLLGVAVAMLHIEPC